MDTFKRIFLFGISPALILLVALTFVSANGYEVAKIPGTNITHFGNFGS